MAVSGVDFGRIARLYGKYRPPFPNVLFERLLELGVGQPGQRVLDLGTGVGTFARELAKRSCLVTGLDKNAALIQRAVAESEAEDIDVRYIQAPAEDTGQPDRSFGAVTACGSWQWFEARRVAQEAMRVLKADGMLGLVSYEWVPLQGGVVEATEHMVLQANPSWIGGGCGLHAEWLNELAVVGYQDLETFSFDVEVPFSREAWRGRVRASSGVGASLEPDAVARFDEDLRLLLQDRFPAEPIRVLHRVFATVGRKALDVELSLH